MIAVPAQSDADARQTNPTQNRGTAATLRLRGTGSSLAEYGFVYFTRPFPLGATISLATLKVYRSGAWSGTKTVNVRRVSEAWAESVLNYTNRPAVAGATATLAANAGADGSLVAVDVTAVMQEVASGSVYFGLRIDLTQDAEAMLRSSESADPNLRPVLEVEWAEVPDAPDRLAPADGDAVQASKPLLMWQASDQTSSQVQVATDSAFTALVLDTGKLAGTAQQLDTNTTTLPAIPAAGVRYWRVRVWNGADVVSPYSATAQLVRTALPALAITVPAGTTVAETAPPIGWTFTGQTRYRVTLQRVETNGDLTTLWRTNAAGGALTVTPPPGLIRSGSSYLLTVESWDGVQRAYDEHALATKTLTYARSNTPTAPTGLTAALYDPLGYAPSPAVLLEWHRTALPDYWCLRVDGVEVADRIDPSTSFVSGDLHRLYYWGLAPRVAHTLEVEAVVQASSGAPLLHSGPNPTASFTSQPIGVWLVDETTANKVPGDAVQLLGQEAADLNIGEVATTYTPIGSQAPVRVTDQVRGYEGSVAGSLHTDLDRDTLLRLKGRQQQLRLILQHLSLPVWVETVTAEPTPVPSDPLYQASVSFFQVGEPWPVP